MNERKITQQKRGSAKKWKRDIQRNWSMREKKKTEQLHIQCVHNTQSKIRRCKNVWFHSGYIPNLDRHIGSGTYEFFSTRGKYLNFFVPSMFRHTTMHNIYSDVQNWNWNRKKPVQANCSKNHSRAYQFNSHDFFFFFIFCLCVQHMKNETFNRFRSQRVKCTHI